MTLDKKDLFERTKKLWPDEIELNSKSIDGTKILNEIYNKIEASIKVDDHWMQISIWAFHQAIPEKPSLGSSKILPSNVTFEIYNRMMINNLTGDNCWEEERKIYLGIL